MCLFDKKRFRISTKPIKVYKIVLNGEYSPFFRCKLHHINIQFPNIFHIRSKSKGFYNFDKGFFHAYTKLDVATMRMAEIYQLFHLNLKIVEGYVPRFTRYAFNEQTQEICSRILILNN